MTKPDNILTIAADPKNLETVTAFINRQAELTGTPENIGPKLELVIEELFLNIVNHANPKSKQDVEISCTRQKRVDNSGEMFCLSTRDWGPDFNPLEKEKPLLEDNVDDRPIGGLGIFLVLQMADHCSYERQNDSNLFSACFNL